MKHVLTVDSFYGKAAEMREVFESRFRDPRAGASDRFVWDFWFVPDQYRLVRTPAYHYFPARMYQAFHSSLVQWGRENLGCHDISPPWLSYYVDGCRQELHADVPHGPWAFVYSLTPKKIKFHGGETLILKPEVLNYWPGFSDAGDREHSSFVDRVKSPFNRLTVFDPRFPHGVTEVRGVEDPLEARLVVHGWFVEPRPYVVGPLSTRQVGQAMEEALGALGLLLPEWGAMHGTVSFRLEISPGGEVREFRWLTDTLMGLEDSARQRRQALAGMKKLFQSVKFPRAKSASRVTVPLLFK
ncbi:MAG: hypothetical protein KF802_07955 [Bdellovibrionaceae bacterium]|nr:hypothetical protein [Pseudobdellovibrionaceae bacterium]MBX3034526.1 hypothetical protein [Pseudobdellovibrionaceae bacterium]